MLGEQALGATTVVARLDNVRAGVPDHEVEKVAAEWQPLGIDTLVAIGGGSAIDTAKALALLLGGVGSELSEFFVRPGEVRDYPGGDFPTVVAVPTTLSGAEVTVSAGISTGSEKRLIRVEQISPRIVCADPGNLLPTPQKLLASTGFCALAHGIETVYSVKRNPAATALALRSAALLGAGLGELPAGAPLTEQAARLLASGATLAALALKGCSSGLQHVICQVLGGAAGVPHGVGHSIMLPSVLRFNRPDTRQEQECFSEAVGVFWTETEGDLPAQAERLREVTGRRPRCAGPGCHEHSSPSARRRCSGIPAWQATRGRSPAKRRSWPSWTRHGSDRGDANEGRNGVRAATRSYSAATSCLATGKAEK